MVRLENFRLNCNERQQSKRLCRIEVKRKGRNRNLPFLLRLFGDELHFAEMRAGAKRKQLQLLAKSHKEIKVYRGKRLSLLPCFSPPYLTNPLYFIII